MVLPDPIQKVIDDEAATIPPSLLKQAAMELSRGYRNSVSPPRRIESLSHRLAYLVSRMPAIFAANLAVAMELKRLRPALEVGSVLDLGCGPATATIAVRQVFEGLQTATLLDRDAEWLNVARRLIDAADPPMAAQSRFAALDLRASAALDEHDLVVISYALGELPPNAAKTLIDQAWARARLAMAIIEPGTPRGFAAVLAARDSLVAAGAGVVAPCTHAGPCPLRSGDWCHFDIRVERTRQHRQAKSATLPYEVEKFSYLVVAKNPSGQTSAARIIRHPLKKGGHVILDLCTSAARAERVIIARRDPERYRRARAARWGDLWGPAED
jgi:ribosomal protein RSM22 (predicted rRNA methylase)